MRVFDSRRYIGTRRSIVRRALPHHELTRRQRRLDRALTRFQGLPGITLRGQGSNPLERRLERFSGI